jgi:mRNA interferase MazF
VVSRPQRDGPQRDEVWLVVLDPTQGTEMQKSRPCLVISPDEMNRHLRIVIHRPHDYCHAAPPHASGSSIPGKTRAGGLGPTALDRQRLVRMLGAVSAKTAQDVSATLLEMFTRT